MTMGQLKKWEAERIALKIKMDERLDELIEIEKKFKSVKNAFPILISYIGIGDEVGTQSAIEFMCEILQSSKETTIKEGDNV